MITHKIKNLTILALFVLLLLSGGLNLWQNKVRKAAEFQAMLDLANSNTLIAQKQGEILIRDSLISEIRQERHSDSLKNSVSQKALKQRVEILTAKIEKLPQEI